MSGDKIVSLRGGVIPTPGTPRPEVVRDLEWALEAARSGEIVGMVAIYNHSDETTTSAASGYHDRATVGVMEIVKCDLVDVLRK